MGSDVAVESPNGVVPEEVEADENELTPDEARVIVGMFKQVPIANPVERMLSASAEVKLTRRYLGG
jgi:hypothetical protein